MKNVRLFLLPLSLFTLSLASCSLLMNPSNSGNVTTSISQTDESTDEEDADQPYTPTDDEDYDWSDPTITGDFSILNENGEASGFTKSGTTYTINTAGTYTLKGLLQGRIIIDATSSSKIELDLEGFRIESSENSPIYATKKVDTLKIKAVEGTTNVVMDNRAAKTTEDDNQFEGAIAGKCDMNFIGKGELQVYGGYNNGIHTSKDLKIKNLHLYSYGNNHAIRGGNSIAILNTSTYVKAVAKIGDGLKSNDGAVSDKGKQKGTISITGGIVKIDSMEDGIDAAYDVIVSKGVDEDTEAETTPTINIYTDKYATLTKAGWHEEGNTDKSATTAKGMKAANSIAISDGKIYMKVYDDGLHANNDYLTDSDDNQLTTKGTGNIAISGGTTTIDASDDGVHADGTLTIEDGVVNVTNSYEGLEGQHIVISGGTTRVEGKDDGLNAANADTTSSVVPTITISGGFLEVGVPSTDDHDGIDSNGTYTQTGGIVVCKGPNSNNAAALDHDKEATVSGGTLIALGAIEGYGSSGGNPPRPGGPSGGTFTCSLTRVTGLSLQSSGSHTFSVDGVSYTIKNSYTYAQTLCFTNSTIS